MPNSNANTFCLPHYDHIGTRPQPNQTDTIFNGARDNGMGVTALLAAAKALAQAPPKRSVLCLALTGEEVGLLGSQLLCRSSTLAFRQGGFQPECRRRRIQ
jgi:Zn-dependent M28 family amino/carboxypeptidase